MITGYKTTAGADTVFPFNDKLFDYYETGVANPYISSTDTTIYFSFKNTYETRPSLFIWPSSIVYICYEWYVTSLTQFFIRWKVISASAGYYPVRYFVWSDEDYYKVFPES